LPTTGFSQFTGSVSDTPDQDGGTMALKDIQSNFEFLDEWEDRYRYVIELGRDLEPLDDTDRVDANKVQGCASQVWLATVIETDSSGKIPLMRFTGDSDAHIVRGLIAILFAIYSGHTAIEILNTDAHAIFNELGLGEHLTPQRSNGFVAMVERIRSDAQTAVQNAQPVG
jgi:cysteine desulfuration protein SufE